MTKDKSLESPLEEAIREQVDRVGKTVAGEFDEVSEEGAAKYYIKVHQSVNYLESLSMPLIDEEYTEKKKELLEKDNEKNYRNKARSEKKERPDFLEKAKTKYRLLVELLHRRGVL